MLLKVYNFLGDIVCSFLNGTGLSSCGYNDLIFYGKFFFWVIVIGTISYICRDKSD